MQLEIIVAFIVGLTVGLQFFLRAQYRHLEDHVKRLENQLDEKESVPYLQRQGMEDAIAPGVDLLLDLERMRTIQENNSAWLDKAELKIKRQIELYGQVRGGTWNKDQPASPSDSTRDNGSP